MSEYRPLEIEAKWRRHWEEVGAHTARLDPDGGGPHCYCLVMFSYPSGDKLHLGHWFNYAPTDSWARFRRMRGDHVFQPMGFDSFGLPAENFAIKSNVHPRVHTDKNIATMREQLRAIGAMYDWRYEVQTHAADYYKWTQWLFLTLLEGGYAYRAEAPVNWCDHCRTVLANEQATAGCCERCDNEVRQRELTQWFFRITTFCEELLEGLERVEWPRKTVAMQRNWIGKSVGAHIHFRVDESTVPEGEIFDPSLTVFTTRPDTVFGVTYMVLAPEHPLLSRIVGEGQRVAVEQYVAEATRLKEIERTSTSREKSGVFTGASAINPVNGERIPIWIADYVLATYGTGAVMAVPAHDERDFEFASSFGLPIRRVILGEGKDPDERLEGAWTEPGPMCRSAQFDGRGGEEAIAAVIAWLEETGKGASTTNYRLRDWLISRQRYWGAPIPIVHCPACGEVPVPLEQLPVELPDDVEFKPTGESPLAAHPTWRHTPCPRCGIAAEREVDTMDTFVDSSWYFLRYLSPHLKEAPFDRTLEKEWLPVHQYVGGAEHAVMHLLYARFVAKALHRMGHVDFDEPFTRLVHQGTITAGGAKMSKSRGNVVSPEEFLEGFGSDTLRAYLMFGFEYQRGGDWDASGIHGMFKYLSRVYRFVDEHRDALAGICDQDVVGRHDGTEANMREPVSDDSAEFEKLRFTRHNSVKGATQDIQRFQFNTAISRHMEFTNALHAYAKALPVDRWDGEAREVLRDWVRLLAPLAPHLGEELWQSLGDGGSVFDQNWPEWDESVLQRDVVNLVLQVNGKVRDQMTAPREMDRAELEEQVLAYGRIPEWTRGKEVRKVIVVPDKLVNIVVG